MAVILLTDDDDSVRYALALLLRGAGHEVHEASHGDAALTMMETQMPDLLITDVYMPGIDGVQLIQEVRKRNPGLKILGISGGGMHRDPKLAISLAEVAGANRVLPKPIMNDLLLEEVAKLVGGSSVNAGPQPAA